MATRSESPIPLVPLQETDSLLAEVADFDIHSDLHKGDHQTNDLDDQQEAKTAFQDDSVDLEDLLTTSTQDIVPTEQQRVQDALKQLTNLNILITGLTGSGKSSLTNVFLGKKDGETGAVKEGEAIEEGCTKQVRGRGCVKNQQSGIKIWDTPGLVDGTAKEKQYLDEMKCLWKLTIWLSTVLEQTHDL